MRAGRRSVTAESTAALRAAHQILDAEPRVLEDEFAARLLLPPTVFPGATLGMPRMPRLRRRLEAALREVLPPWLRTRRPIGIRRIRAQVVVRSRYAEDCLEQAMARGVHQYLILAAGLDTFALRRSDLSEGLRVFEVDHPASQESKRQRLQASGVRWPENLNQVPIDFERQSLEEALEGSEFRPDQPVFVSWLGISYYLSARAIAEVFDFVAACAPGSEMVLDFWDDGSGSGVADRLLLDGIRLGVRGQGEPMRSFLTAAALGEAAEAAGLKTLEILSAREAQLRYLKGRTDGLRMPDFSHLARLAPR